jgi:amino acid adenylation domain-containing protein
MSVIDGAGLLKSGIPASVGDKKTAEFTLPDGSRAVRLTPTQRDLYLYEVANPGSTMFNVGTSVNLGTEVDAYHWEQAVIWVVGNNDVAGTSFTVHRGEAIQQIAPDNPIYYVYADLLKDANEALTAAQYLTVQSERPYQLSVAPLLRNFLVKDKDGTYTAAILAPHVVLDGMTMKVYLEQIGSVYQALLQGTVPALEASPDFHDFVGRDLPDFDTDEIRRYWAAKLQNVAPLDFALHRDEGGDLRSTLFLDEHDTSTIRRYCQQQGCNMPTFFMALYALLLRRYADCTEDIVLFSVRSGRPRAYQRTLGCFYQVLPYLFPAELGRDECLVSEQLNHVAQYKQDLNELQNISMSLLNQLLPADGIKCFLNYQSFALFDLLGEKRACRVYMNHPDDEIHLAVTETGATIMLELYSNERRFPELSFLERIGQLARQACRPSARLGELEIMLPAERERLQQEVQATTAKFNAEPTVQNRFETQAQRRPDARAVTYPQFPGARQSTEGGTQGGLSYAELNRRANQLAHQLRRRGVGPDTLVAVLLERSLDLVVAILAVVKAGGAYVPVDPDYPISRIEFMLQDSGSRVLVTRRDLARRVDQVDCDRLCLDTDRDLIGAEATQDPEPLAGPDNLAYVIYTSGSTGTPKGVMVTHANLSRLLTQTEAWFNFDEHDVWTLFHSSAFDFSVWEFWGALTHGGRLVVVSTELCRSPEDFYQVLQTEQVSVLNQTPSAFYQLMRVDERSELTARLALRCVIFGGEALNLSALKPWVERHGDERPQLVNMYGITETTVHVTYRRLRQSDIESHSGSLIGRPIPDLFVCLVDSSLRPVPAGLVGEICVAGAGVARGYLGRPELTRERFVPDFLGVDTSTKVYRSGDQGRLLADGEIEYLGRVDDQVKIRGFRIEPGEIDAALLQHPNISAAITVACAEGGPGVAVRHGDIAQTCERRLVAYLVLKDAELHSVTQLRIYLGERLPDYMLPAAFVTLEALPLTPNGKVDRHRLPAPGPERPELEQLYVAPRNERERALAGLIESVLRIEGVGIYDNFFDLGGNSLAAMQLATHVWDHMGAELALGSIFEHPTIAQLVEQLQFGGPGRKSLPVLTLKPAPRTESMPVSFSQERIWFLLQLNPGNRAYEFLTTIRLTGKLDVEALRNSLSEIVRRHEIYRTSFALRDSQPRQFIHAPWNVALPIVDLDTSGAEAEDRIIENKLRELVREPFVLDQLPLIRWTLLKLNENNHILVHFEHHLLHDGWSFVVFLKEFLALYRAYVQRQSSPLAELSIQFCDFAYWQRQWMQQGVAEVQLEYWRQKLAGCPALLKLPTDHPRPALASNSGDSLRLDYSPEFSAVLKSCSREQDVTVHMLLFTAFVILLSRYTGTQDIVVGTGIANRRWQETENMMGMLLNNVTLRIDLSGDPSVAELLRRVRHTALEAYQHQDVPFDQVVEAVNPPRSASYPPLFQVLFTSYDGEMPVLDLPGLSVTFDEGLSLGTAKFDLNIVVVSRDKKQARAADALQAENISLIWEYNSDLFERSSMERMTGHYRNILDALLDDQQQRLSALDLMSASERQQLLLEWNQTTTDYPREATLPALFEQQAQSRPDAVALEFEQLQLSYGELNRRANQLAHYLRRRGVGPEVPVGLCLERSLQMVIGLLGILKAGGAYLPLDPDYPPQRLQFMLDDSSAALVITLESQRELLPQYSGEVLALDTQHDDLVRESEVNPEVALTATNLAYIMYTSGSTGTPKGVCVEHRSVLRLVLSTDYVQLGPDEVFLQLAPISFDASTLELWGSLLNGARLVVYPAREPTLDELGSVIRERGITTLWLSAGLFHQMVDNQPQNLSTVRQLLAGGEALSLAHVNRARELLGEDCRIINGYGPTENTTFTCCYPITAATRIEDTVPIGRPIANTRVYVLDTQLQPVPVGIAGELCIGGDGLAREYLNRPELTAERFVEASFPEAMGERLYRSGDLVRYRADGVIEFLGRLDHQVKLHGFRIEPGEVEAALERHSQVHDSLVLVHEQAANDKRLLAYLIGKTVNRPSVGELRGFLDEELPRYMFPSAFIWIDSWPLTPNGKLDRSALPLPEEIAQPGDGAIILPRTETEKTIAALWSEVLPLDEIGVYDDFFSAGGHSLLAGQVMNRLRDVFGLEIPMRCLFDDPTVAGLAAYVEAASWGDQKPVDEGDRGDREQGKI